MEMKKFVLPTFRVDCAILSVLLGLALSATAATTSSWVLETGGYWNTPGNWSPAEVPNAPEATAFVNNAIAAAAFITNDVNVTLGTLWIGHPTGAYGFTLTNDLGTAWKFDNNGAGALITQSGTGSSTDRLSSPVELADNLTASNETITRTLALMGTISESGGPKTITKLGDGYLTLGTANTFSGGVFVKAGRLNAAGAGRAGTGVITLGDTSGTSGADLIGNGTYTNSIVVVPGSSGKKVMRNSGGSAAVNYSGPITLNDNLELQAVSSTRSNTVTGVISGDGAVTTTSVASGSNAHYVTNFVALKAANTFTGGVTLQTGTLKVGNHAALGTGTLTINDGTILCSDGNSNRQLTNDVIVNGNFRIGVPPPYGAGTIAIWKTVDLGAVPRTITLGSTVGHYIRGSIIGTGGLVLQDLDVKGLNLYGANTFSGGVTILNGNIGFLGDSAFGTGMLALGDSTTTTNIQITGNGTVANDIMVMPGVSGSRTLGCTNYGTAVYSGSIYLGTDLIVGVASATYPRTIIVSGPVSGPGSLLVNGAAPNSVTLSGANSYDGTTTVAGGTLVVSNTTGSATGNGAVTVRANAVLAGTGILGGTATLEAGAALAPGVAGLGRLTFNNTLTLATNSTVLMELDKALGTNDVVAASAVNYGGTLMVTNLNGNLAAGDAFQLFTATGPNSGNFSAIVVSGTTLKGQFDPVSGILSLVSGTATTPTNISYGFDSASSKLTLSWPESHLGWSVQSNSVSVTDPNAWYDIEGSAGVTSLDLTVNPSLPQVYYRLRLLLP